ncbi:hypothetical protein FKR81_02045 [Lentzea tibetensis]|uniref:Uncharacterized protein n=1 Tax=Lentzea tibetensis TaxID=2591470 RepID=A0A563F3K2_9PSEU|nr:hypothetical protein [Lentzea tibetensis]TWP54351.1 hypothetical protein FKR81_02045 [Lentzea tibetensis]
MKIEHRVSLNSTPEIRAELAELGVPAGPENEPASRMITFTVEETAPHWPEIAELIDRSGALDVVSTKFTKKEIEQAGHVQLEPSWHHGYPQPEDDYLSATYDLSDYCEECGIGARQKAPFRMKGEPKWGKKSLLQLNWIFDEFFVTPALWEAVFRPLGVPRQPVLGKNDVELATVVQLVVVDEVQIDSSGLAATRCPSCGRVKYLPVTRGFFPAPVGDPGAPLVRTIQYFGSGASAFRPVVAEQRVARALSDHKAQGASLRPISFTNA